jgi:thiamine biosynthesis lipoprotein
MGTRFEIVAEGDDEANVRAACEAALAEIEEWDARLTLFRPSSFLSYINTHAAMRPVQLDDDLYELISESLAVHRASQGAFDITLAPLMRAWGFHEEPRARQRDTHSRGSTPGSSPPRPRADFPCGMSDLDLDADRRTIRFRREGMGLDLGGIAKGHALDLAAAVLREGGVHNALLHGGTSTIIGINASRTRAGEDHWPVGLGIEQPGISVKLCNAAMSVSAPHGRVIDMDGTALGHIIDPREGAPARRTHLAVVIAPSARLADAWSTALIVLGQRPPKIPDSLTTLIARETEDAMDWRVGGAKPELFSLRPLCGILEWEDEYD